LALLHAPTLVMTFVIGYSILLLIVFIHPFRVNAQSSWQQLGADTYKVAFCGENALLVTSQGRILREENGTWRYAAICPSGAYAIAFRDRSGVVFGNHYSMRSDDSGKSWITSSDTFYHDQTLAWPSADTVYNSTVSGEILQSTDRGQNWKSIKKIARIRALDFQSGAVGYAALDDGILLRTVDAGKTWIEINTHFKFQIGVIRCALDTVVVAGEGSEFFISTDGGVSWKHSEAQVGVDLAQIFDFQIAPEGIWYAVGRGNGSRTIIYSTDQGSSWQLPTIETGYFAPVLISLDFINKRGLAVGTDGSIFETVNSGLDWRIVSLSAIQVAFSTNFIYNIQVGDSGRLYVVGANGVICTSSDNGLTWMTSKVKEYGQTFLRVHEYSQSIAMASGLDSTFYRTTDGGKTWSKYKNFAPWTYPAILQRGTSLWMAGSKFILQSKDSGTNWTIIDSLPMVISDMLILPNGQLGVVGGGAGKAFFAISNQEGKEWQTTVFDTINGLYDVTYMSGDSLMACGRNGLLMLSTDMGITWSPRSAGMSSFMTEILYVNDSVMVAGTDLGVLESNDRGSSWQKVVIPNLIRRQDNDDTHNSITGLSVSNDGRLIYAAGTDFVYVRGLIPYAVQKSWVAYGRSRNIYLRIKPYPNPSIEGNAKASIWGLATVRGQKRSLALYNMLGVKVIDLDDQINRDLQALSLDIEFDTGDLAGGTYMLVLDAGGDRLSEQIVVY
jgi:photosystem II stability/assembly factor-like uncharacterized protein